MGRKGTLQRPKGTPTARLCTTVLPATLAWLQESADRNGATVGRMLDVLAIAAAQKNRRECARTSDAGPLRRVA